MVVSPSSFPTWSLTPTLSRAIRIFSLLGAAAHLYLSNWRTLSTVFFTMAVHDWVFFLALATRLVNNSSQHFTFICGCLALLMAGGLVFRPAAFSCVVLFAVASFLAKSYFEMWIVCCGAAGVLLLGLSVAFAPGGAPGMAAAATFLWCNIWQLISRFLISNLLMPSVTFSKEVLDTWQRRSHRSGEQGSSQAVPWVLQLQLNSPVERQGLRVERLRLTSGGFLGLAELDTVTVQQPSEDPQEPGGGNKWVMWFVGNGEFYEADQLSAKLRLAMDLGVNILTCNLRDVGTSRGLLCSCQDMVEDAVSCLDYLQTRHGARPEHVLLFGHSMGGAVATELAARYSPYSPVVNKQSFSSLSLEASLILPLMLGSAGRVLAPLVGILLPFVFGGALNMTPFDSVRRWPRICTPHKLLVFHRQDEIIPMEASMLVGLRKNRTLGDTTCVELKGKCRNPHNEDWAVHSHEGYQETIALMRTALDIA